MANGAFTWHPDQDDVYDGDRLGNQTLSGPSYSAFSKKAGKSFTMKGDDALLILEADPFEVGTIADWGGTPPVTGATTQIRIERGTLQLQPSKPNPGGLPGMVWFGADESVQYLTVDVTGTLVIEDTVVFGKTPDMGDMLPTSTINIRPGGTFRVGQSATPPATEMTGSFYINVYEQGSVSLTAYAVGLSYGAVTLYGSPASGAGTSFEVIAVPLTPSELGTIEIGSQEIACKSASVSRLQARSMSFADADIKAGDTASITLACDAIGFDDNDVVFALGQGSPVMTFTGLDDGPAPFKFLDAPAGHYPKGLFNFLTDTKGDNTGKFRFHGVGSAFDFSKMHSESIITVNGAFDKDYITDYMWEPYGSDPHGYFVIYIK